MRTNMTIYENIKEILKDRKGDTVTLTEVKELLLKKYNINLSSIILSDYCYNCYNNGVTFNNHIFVYVDRGIYKYIGENALYTGLIYHKQKGSEEELVVGERVNGKESLHKNHRMINE